LKIEYGLKIIFCKNEILPEAECTYCKAQMSTISEEKVKKREEEVKKFHVLMDTLMDYTISKAPEGSQIIRLLL